MMSINIVANVEAKSEIRKLKSIVLGARGRLARIQRVFRRRVRQYTQEEDKVQAAEKAILALENSIALVEQGIEAAENRVDLSMDLLRGLGLTVDNVGFSKLIKKAQQAVDSLNAEEETADLAFYLAKIKSLRLLYEHHLTLYEGLRRALDGLQSRAYPDQDDKVVKFRKALRAYRERISTVHKFWQALSSTRGTPQARLEKFKKFLEGKRDIVTREEEKLERLYNTASKAWLEIREVGTKFWEKKEERERVQRGLNREFDRRFYADLGVMVVSLAVLYGIFHALRKLSKSAYRAMKRAYQKVRAKYNWLPGKPLTPQVKQEFEKQVGHLPPRDKKLLLDILEDAKRRRRLYEQKGRKELRKAEVNVSAVNSHLLQLPISKIYDQIKRGYLSSKDIVNTANYWGIDISCVQHTDHMCLQANAAKVVYKERSKEDMSFEDALLTLEGKQWAA